MIIPIIDTMHLKHYLEVGQVIIVINLFTRFHQEQILSNIKKRKLRFQRHNTIFKSCVKLLINILFI